MKNIFCVGTKIFENFRKFWKTRIFFEIFEKIKNFENSKFFENLIFQFSNEISEFFKNFGKFSKIVVAEKIFCISYCNFTSNKSIVDFLGIFRCRFVTRRRWIRLERANLHWEVAHKKKNTGVIFSVFVSVIPAPGYTPLLPAVPRCSVMLENHRNTTRSRF